MARYENAVITKARALYGRMLSRTQYDELLRKQSVQEISGYLRDKTTYASVLSEVQDSTVHRGQLENLLHKDMFYQYIRIIRYAGTKDTLFRYIIADMEIELILSCLRGIISRREIDFIAELPAFMQPYASFDIYGMVEVRSVDGLISLLGESPYGAIVKQCAQESRQSGDEINYTIYEVALRTYYFEQLLLKARSSVHGKALKQLNELITLRAELTNINSIYRLKRYFRASPEQIRKSLLPFYCKISPRTMETLIEAKDLQELLQRLSRTALRDVADENKGFIEGCTDGYRHYNYLKLLRFSTSPQVVFMAFMLLRGMEIENIIRIIEGVRYGMAPEKIQQLLYFY